jgi:hypothetical protein
MSFVPSAGTQLTSINSLAYSLATMAKKMICSELISEVLVLRLSSSSHLKMLQDLKKTRKV